MSYMPVACSSASPEWPTPQWLVDQLAAEFGPFDLDPAATAANAKAPAFYTIADDGLAQRWKGRVWLNPPYGRTDAYGRPLGAWMAKARAEVACGNADRVVALVPARVDTDWWRDTVRAASLVRYLPGRIKWRNGQPAPFGNAVIVLGALPGRHGTSHKTCVICDGIFWPARADAKTCSPKCRAKLSRITRRNRDAAGAAATSRKDNKHRGKDRP